MQSNISASSEFSLKLFLPTFGSEKIEVAMCIFIGLGVSEKAYPIPDQANGHHWGKPGVQDSLSSDPQMASDDSFFYLGTTTGDILKMNPRTKLMADTGPVKDKFSLVSGDHSLLCFAVFIDFFYSLPMQTLIKEESVDLPKATSKFASCMD